MKIKRPNRVEHGYTQHLQASPEVVFRLLCPVMEEEWVPGWSPEFVLSNSGVAEAECIFATPGEPVGSIWIISRHDPDRFYIEMYKVTPQVTVAKLRIQLRREEEHNTAADIWYEYTALSDDGDQFVEQFTRKAYDAFMVSWESALNQYLNTL